MEDIQKKNFQYFEFKWEWWWTFDPEEDQRKIETAIY